MAVAFVTGKYTAGGASAAVLVITKPTSGNVLAVFIVKTTEVSTAPKIEDNGGKGETGWVVNATKALGNASAHSLWFATKVAEGTETELKTTGGTIAGLGCTEWSGASTTVDVIANTDNFALAKTATTASYTDTDAGDALLVCVGLASASGTISAWTGGPPTLKNDSGTTTARTIMGNSVPGEVVSAKTFTANWLTERAGCLLAVTLKPAVAFSAPPWNFLPPTFRTPASRYVPFPPASAEPAEPEPKFEGAITEKFAYKQVLVGEKGASGSTIQKFAFVDVITAIKAASAAITQFFAFKQKDTAEKATSASISQKFAYIQTDTGQKATSGAISQKFAYIQAIQSLEAFEGAIVEKFAYVQKISGEKAALGTITQKFAQKQTTTGFRSAIAAITQKFALRQLASAFKSTTGVISEKFALKQTIEAGKAVSKAISQFFAFKQKITGEQSVIEEHEIKNVFPIVSQATQLGADVTAGESHLTISQTYPLGVDTTSGESQTSTSQPSELGVKIDNLD